MTGPLAPLFARVRTRYTSSLGVYEIFEEEVSSIERHVKDAVALLDECLNDGDRAWDPEELVAQMEKVRAALPAREGIIE